MTLTINDAAPDFTADTSEGEMIWPDGSEEPKPYIRIVEAPASGAP